MEIPDARPRCGWCLKSPEELAYHDAEWGLPLHDDRAIFEFLVLESFQAGLSWLTILRKREQFRRAFAGFDPEQVARFGEADQARLLADPGIVRHRQKIAAAIRNARAFLALQAERGSVAAYFWNFVDGRPVVNRWQELGQIPAKTPLADAVAKDLKARGFAFLGPTTVYAHLQATGVVNDHLESCFRWAEVQAGSNQAS
ncbi:DNA-3-methyladenine glycosylase I [Megalodesulfovibrio paquesii]